uniref:non-specific serine/threonine protein kinase n=1 Tax=Quercus lobata TaxID=97700 RepID=A0A7N2MJ51_QUELO
MDKEEVLTIPTFDGRTIPTFDGRIMYQEIIDATQGFDAKFCIGEGGYGTIYKAKLISGDAYAVKKLTSSCDGNISQQKEFLNEISALTEIQHRNIVKLHGFCSHSRFSILIYKYLEKGNLASILSNDGGAKELDWNKRVNIVKGVAHALSYIHHDCLPPIVHRDISSKNILLGSEYEAHVSDFGIAKILNQDLSNWTSLAGTYGYLAPDIFPPISGYHSRHPNSLTSSREANANARYTPPTMHTSVSKSHHSSDSIPELKKIVFAVQAMGNIRVFVGVASEEGGDIYWPLRKEEISTGYAMVTDFGAAKDGELGPFAGGLTKKIFKFDQVYTPKDDQVDVFMDASPMVVSVYTQKVSDDNLRTAYSILSLFFP